MAQTLSSKRFEKSLKNRKIPSGKLDNCCTFVTVFHRILDFKNGAGFLSGPHFFLPLLIPNPPFHFIFLPKSCFMPFVKAGFVFFDLLALLPWFYLTPRHDSRKLKTLHTP
jgi:hypothetical protein